MLTWELLHGLVDFQKHDILGCKVLKSLAPDIKLLWIFENYFGSV